MKNELKKLRILLVHEAVDPKTGGATLYVLDMARGLAAMGHEVALFHGENHQGGIQGASTVVAFPGWFGFNYRYSRALLDKLNCAAAEFSPDLVYVNQVLNPTVVETLARRFPAIRYEHSLRLACPSGRSLCRDTRAICTCKGGWQCVLYAYSRGCMPRNVFLSGKRVLQFKANLRAHRYVRRIIVASDYVKRRIANGGIQSGRINVMPYFTEIPFRPRSFPPEKPLVLFLGRLTKEKGCVQFMEAINIVRQPVRVVVGGEGPELQVMKEMAAQSLTHRFEFPGWVSGVAKEDLLRSATLVAATSMWPEPFGIFGIEAMAYGVPVVAFDTGGISDWLSHEKTGLLVTRGDVAGFARAVERLVVDRQGNCLMGEEGRRIALQEYTWERHCKRLLELFSEVLSGK